MPTHEINGTGWRVATILGALLCAAVGALISFGVIYTTHLSWSGEKASEIDTKLAVADSDRADMRSDVNQLALSVERIGLRMDSMTRALERLADSNCYRDTGKPCSRAMLDERP